MTRPSSGPGKSTPGIEASVKRYTFIDERLSGSDTGGWTTTLILSVTIGAVTGMSSRSWPILSYIAERMASGHGSVPGNQGPCLGIPQQLSKQSNESSQRTTRCRPHSSLVPDPEYGASLLQLSTRRRRDRTWSLHLRAVRHPCCGALRTAAIAPVMPHSDKEAGCQDTVPRVRCDRIRP